jgi:hypothetical protein
MENSRECYLYYIYNPSRHAVKIGISVNPQKRLKTLQCASPDKLKIFHSIRFDSVKKAFNAEQTLHKVFRSKVIRPHKNGPQSEWFHEEVLISLMTRFRTEHEIKANAEGWSKIESIEAKKKAAKRVSLRN